MTIPPYGPVGGGPYAGPGGPSNADLLAELHGQRQEIADLRARLEDQGHDVHRVHRRAGWILLWVCVLTFFGGCAGARTGDTARVEEQLRRLQQSVDVVHQQQLQQAPAPAARTP